MTLCRLSLLYYLSHASVITTIAYTLLVCDILEVQVIQIVGLTKPTLVSTVQGSKTQCDSVGGTGVSSLFSCSSLSQPLLSNMELDFI